MGSTMTMAAIELGSGRRLDLEPTRNVVQLYPAAGGAELELAVRVIDAGQPIDRENFALAATVYMSDSRQQNRRLLCRVRAGHHTSPTQRGAEVRLKGMTTDEQ